MRTRWWWCLIGFLLLSQSGCCWWRPWCGPHHCGYPAPPEAEPIPVMAPPH